MKNHPRDILTDQDWEELKLLFPKRTRTGSGRNFLEALLYKARTGSPWRDLPERFGPWLTIHKRFSRWAQRGFFSEILKALQEKKGIVLTEASLDSTSVKLHPSSHGSKKKISAKEKAKEGGTRKSMLWLTRRGDAWR